MTHDPRLRAARLAGWGGVMGAKHTPGPWAYDETVGHVHRADDFRPQRDAIADTNANDLPEEEGDANGVLMAAAPDLAAACVTALQHVVAGWPRNLETETVLVAALEKAGLR